MSTTIERACIVMPIVLLAWIAVMAVVMRVSDAAPAAVAILPGERLMARLPEDTQILGLNRFALTVVNRPGTSKALYAAGALLVLPAGLTGCLPLSKAQRGQL